MLTVKDTRRAQARLPAGGVARGTNLGVVTESDFVQLVIGLLATLDHHDIAP